MEMVNRQPEQTYKTHDLVHRVIIKLKFIAKYKFRNFAELDASTATLSFVT